MPPEVTNLLTYGWSGVVLAAIYFGGRFMSRVAERLVGRFERTLDKFDVMLDHIDTAIQRASADAQHRHDEAERAALERQHGVLDRISIEAKETRHDIRSGLLMVQNTILARMVEGGPNDRDRDPK